MFGMDITMLVFIALAAASAAAIAYVLMFETIAREKQVERRLDAVKKAETDHLVMRATRDRVAEAAKRRRTIQENLKELENKQKNREQYLTKPPLRIQLRQAGIEISLERFYIVSAICGLALTAALYMAGAPLLALPGAFIAGSLGVPRWAVAFKRKRRVKAFLNEFPNALDVIVRAVKSGLPVNDAIRMITTEAQEPVRTEFRRMVEAQQLGLSIAEAAQRMSETMPCPEANFFGIVMQIQSQAGGNLSEALGNLSRVLRDRKKMKAKIKALSAEARASAAIIGSLPIIVAVLVFITSPGYIMPLFTTSPGNLILGVSAIWMAIGVFVMRQMMNFEV